MRIALVDDSEIERGILLSLITDYGCEKQTMDAKSRFYLNLIVLTAEMLFCLPFRLINTILFLWTFL